MEQEKLNAEQASPSSLRRYAAPDWMVLEPMQRAGQIEKNDTLILNTEHGVRAAKAMKVKNAGTPDEEVVINIIKNKFFHTGMALAGTSWVKNVLILKAA